MTFHQEPQRFSGAYQHAEPTEVPEPWYSAMRDAGHVNPQTGEPSMQALYRASGVHASAISRILSGRTRIPRGETIMSLAKALDRPFPEVASWVDVPYSAYKPWEPPKVAHLMSDQNRRTVETLIHQLVNAQNTEDYREMEN